MGVVFTYVFLRAQALAPWTTVRDHRLSSPVTTVGLVLRMCHSLEIRPCGSLGLFLSFFPFTIEPRSELRIMGAKGRRRRTLSFVFLH